MADADERMQALYLDYVERAMRAMAATPLDPDELERAAERLRSMAGELLELALNLDRAAWAVRRTQH